jgi:hypothetical protein
MIIHDTSLKACAASKSAWVLELSKGEAYTHRWAALGRILGRHRAMHDTGPGWLVLRPGRRVITSWKRHYAHRSRLVSAGVLLAGRQ